MANYRFQCTVCGISEDRSIPIASYDKEKDTQRCACGAAMERVLMAPPSVLVRGKWRDDVARVGPAEFMRRETK